MWPRMILFQMSDEPLREAGRSISGQAEATHSRP